MRPTKKELKCDIKYKLRIDFAVNDIRRLIDKLLLNLNPRVSYLSCVRKPVLDLFS